MAVIAVDFDNTLVDSEDGYFYPVRGAKEAMERLKAEGHYLIIHTCRTGIASAEGTLDNEIKFIKRCLAEFEIPYDDIFIGEKLIANIYIDDRAVSYGGDWNETIDQVEKHAERWKKMG